MSYQIEIIRVYPFCLSERSCSIFSICKQLSLFTCASGLYGKNTKPDQKYKMGKGGDVIIAEEKRETILNQT